jgi:acetyl-CoA/propionyl-CoA carboxylase, biotin carboxylase, biotin carboxyl carrier protein
MFSSVLMANRGEIAVRVMRTLRALGVESVAVYSDADAAAPHVRAADHAVRLGPAPAAESYLHVERVIEAALKSGAEAVHPGYGFLSERPDFARACAEAGLVFVGPSAEAIALLGDKSAAKRVAADVGVPVVPGLRGDALSDVEIAVWAQDQPLPLLVKAVAGGGGKGMRVVRSLDELPAALAAARGEARAAFGDDRLLIERYVERPRHIEVQVIGDTHGTVLHLGERECSLQRRYQKVIEEAPSPAVGPELRERIGAAAVRLARASGYTGAGTVEFIVSGEEFHFLEMNARLQVEHPVTEAVTGLDLVELQLRVAAGEPLPLAQHEVTVNGHSVEARIYAEDPGNGFLPSTGRLVAWRAPADARVDSAVEEGLEVTSHYDPLLAKVIVHADDRSAALRRLERALGELLVVGPATNTAYLRALLARPEVRSGQVDTGLIERLGEAIAPSASDPALPGLALIALVGSPESDDPWDSRDGWRATGRGAAVVRLAGPDGPVEARATPAGAIAGEWCVEPGGPSARLDGDVLRVDGRGIEVRRDGEAVWLVDGGVPTRWVPARDGQSTSTPVGSLEAPMPGVVLDVCTQEGARVAAGDTLVVLESMKMELSIVSPSTGVVTELTVRVGDRVFQGQPLVAVEAA